MFRAPLTFGGMDIMVIEQPLGKNKELIREVSLLTHRRYFGDGNTITLHGVRTPKDLIGAMRAALRDCEIEDNFILTRDTTFITGRFDPVPAYAHHKSLWLKRKGLETDAMITTIRYLLSHNFPTADYEIAVPQVISKGLLMRSFEEMGDDVHQIKTMHFNRLGFVPVQIDDPRLEKWTWNNVPKGPVVTLEETCFAHKDCISWVKGLSHVPADQA